MQVAMIVFLKEHDGSTIEFYYEGITGFVREITLYDRHDGSSMHGMFFFEPERIVFVSNDTIEYEVVGMVPDEF